MYPAATRRVRLSIRGILQLTVRIFDKRSALLHRPLNVLITRETATAFAEFDCSPLSTFVRGLTASVQVSEWLIPAILLYETF